METPNKLWSLETCLHTTVTILNSFPVSTPANMVYFWGHENVNVVPPINGWNMWLLKPLPHALAKGSHLWLNHFLIACRYRMAENWQVPVVIGQCHRIDLHFGWLSEDILVYTLRYAYSLNCYFFVLM